MNTPEGLVNVPIDSSLYSKSSILKATYKFTNDWFVEITKAREDVLNVAFTPKNPNLEFKIREEFLNELLDQRLREQVGAETLAVRNLVMAHALSRLTTEDPYNAGSSPSTS